MGCSSSHRTGNVAAPHHLGGKWDAPQSIGTKCRKPSPPPNEMSELLAAYEGKAMHLIASVVNASTFHRLGREWGAPRGIGMECWDPSLRPDEMSELLTVPE
jgi:hypothetical protein